MKVKSVLSKPNSEPLGVRRTLVNKKADNTVQCQECVYVCRSKRRLRTHVFYAHRRRGAKKAVASVLPSDLVTVTCEPVVAVVAPEPDLVSVPSVAVSEAVNKVAVAESVSPLDKMVEESTESPEPQESLSRPQSVGFLTARPKKESQFPCQQTSTVWSSFVRDLTPGDLHKLRQAYEHQPCSYCNQTCMYQLMMTMRPSY